MLTNLYQAKLLYRTGYFQESKVALKDIIATRSGHSVPSLVEVRAVILMAKISMKLEDHKITQSLIEYIDRKYSHLETCQLRRLYYTLGKA